MPGDPKITRKLLACSVLFAFLLFTFNLALTESEAQTATFQVSVSGTAGGSIPHQIDLKVTQLPGGQLSQVKGFVVGPEDVVQVKQGENIIASTSPDLQIHKVTVTNVQGIPVDLAPLSNNVWSLQGLSPGVYKLDVNAAMSSSGFLGTYETVLAILAPNQQPIPPASIISQITVEENAECPPNLILVNGNCIEPPTPTPKPSPTDYCYLPGVGDWWDNPDCREYLEKKNSKRPVCTPGGPPCPPCPEGVEAGWCADEDERQDTDDCLNEQGEERFPGCSDQGEEVPPRESPEPEEGEEIGNDGEDTDPPSQFGGNENGNGDGNGGDDGNGGAGDVPSEFG